jgi:ribokinase
LRDTTGAGDCFMGYFAQGLVALSHDVKTGQEVRTENVVKMLTKCDLVSTSDSASVSHIENPTNQVQCSACCWNVIEQPGSIDSFPCKEAVDKRMLSTSGIRISRRLFG